MIKHIIDIIDIIEALVIIFSAIIYISSAFANKRKYHKKFKKLFEDTNFKNNKIKKSEWDLFYLKEDFKVFYGVDVTISFIKISTRNSDYELSWKCYNELVNRVIMNIFDNLGKCREVLNSIYEMFRNIRKYAIECYGAKHALPICLFFLNKILRPFCAKWNRELSKKENEMEKQDLDKFDWDVEGNELREKFEEDYEKLRKEKIKENKIIEKFAHLAGIKIKLENVTEN